MAEMKRIVVVGATGQIGQAVCGRLLQSPDYAVVVFSRDPVAARKRVPGAAEYVAWEPEETGSWASAIDGAYAVINVAGAPTFGVRWTRRYRRYLRFNRLTIARGLVRAMEQATIRPRVFVHNSSVGAYGFTTVDTAYVDEQTPPDHDSYAEEVLVVEQEAQQAEALGVRTVVPRAGYVLSRNSGGLPQMAQAARRGRGGVTLPGTQWLPWIHIADEVAIITGALDDERLRGPFNATAPEVPTNRAFMQALGKVLDRPIRGVVPGFVWRLILGAGAVILTRGRRVYPRRLLELGYQFQFPTLHSALVDLLF